MIKKCKQILMCIMVFFIFKAAHATTVCNYVEMGMALSAMTVDMIANGCETKLGQTNTVAALHCIADFLHLAREGLFYQNNAGVRCGNFNRDFYANIAFQAHDIVRLFKHAKTFFSKGQGIGLVDEKPQPEVIDENGVELAKLEYIFSKYATACKVVIIPALKGLTALSIACTQHGATKFGSGRYEQGEVRFLATAAHAFLRLFDEYLQAGAGSYYKKVILVALCANVSWLIAECVNYRSLRTDEREHLLDQVLRNNPEPYVVTGVRHAECDTCQDCVAKELIILHCGDALDCRECLQLKVCRAYGHQRDFQASLVQCSRCHQDMCRADLEHIMHCYDAQESANVMQAYDERRSRNLRQQVDDLINA